MGSLHDDFGLHSFKRIVAELEDGRHAAVEIGADGHMEIISVWEPGEKRDPSYTEQKAMGQEPEPFRKPQDELRDRALADVPEKWSPMTPEEAIKMSQAPKIKLPPLTVPPAGQAVGPGVVQAMQRYRSDPSTMTVMDSAGYSQSVLDLVQQMISHPAYDAGDGSGGKIATVQGEKTVIPRDPVFLAKLGSIMNDNQFDRQLRGRTRGKLDMTRLYKAQTGSSSVFTQKAMRKNKKYNIVLLIDQSGSMRGTPIYTAAECAQFLAEHLNRIPGTELMVVGFGSYQTIHKEFGQHMELNRLMDTILQWQNQAGGGTADVSPLRTSYKELEKLSASQGHKAHNILLYLADGSPNDKNGSNKIMQEHEHNVTTIGVGIMTKHHAKKNVTIQDLAGMKPALMGILQKEIKRG